MMTNCETCGKQIEIAGPLTEGTAPVCWHCADPEIHLDYARIEQKTIAILLTKEEVKNKQAGLYDWATKY